MADPKSTTRFVSTDSKFDFYANVISHAELYANNISANSFNVGSQTLEEYIQSVGGGGGSGDVTNNYVTATFVSNNYLEDIKSTFGTGDVTNNYLTATFSSNNYLTAIFSSNNYLTAIFSSNNYVQDILDTKATNTYVNSTFTSNNYVDGRFTSNSFVKEVFTSNNYVDNQLSTRIGVRATNTYVNDTFVSNNYLQDLGYTTNVGDVTNTYLTTTFTTNNYVDGRFTSNNFVKSVFVSNNYVDTQLGTKLDSSSYTASDVLTKIKTVDGSGSGLDADLLDGLHVLSLASNNYLQSRLTAFGNGDVTNTYLTATFTTNNYTQNHFIRSDQADTKTANLNFSDNVRVTFGDDGDFQILHNGTNTQLNNYTGTLQIIQRADDLDAVIYTDDGSGGITEYVRADGSTGEAILSHYGTHKLSTKSTGIDVSGNVTVSGTVDGRDIASDGSTLDNISGSYTSNNYLVATFAANSYLVSHFTSNNYIQTYVSSEIASLVDSAPTTLDTLNELAAALGDDPNFATTVTNQIGIRSTNTYVNSTFTSNNYVDGRFTSNNYVESQLSNKVSTTHAGDVSITGNVTITSTENGSSAGPDLILYRNSASPNDGDYLGQIQFKGRQDGPGDEIYAKVTGKISDSTNSTEDGLIETAIKGNGTFTIVSRQRSDELQLLNGVGLNVDGSIAVGGTVDGRDIASDGSTLDSISSTYASNNYLVTTFSSNNYLQDRLTAFGNGDVSNNYLVATFTSNNYVQTQLGLKLNSSSYTAADILTKIKTVDGAGSGLDADLLDGQHASAFQTVTAPNSPSITSTAVVNETIELVFGQSSTSGVTRYEVWSDGATGSDYSLIAIIPSQDAAASMSVIDSSFDTDGTVAYRVYAVKNGVYSTAATTTKSFTIPSLDVSNMSVVADITAFHVQYDLPDTRFMDHIEIYKDAETTLSALSRTGAALVYSGSSDNFTYTIPTADLDKFHQFWVEVVSV